MTKLVYLITCFDQGGAETQVAKLAQYFSQSADVHVISLLPMSEQWIDPKASGFTLHQLAMRRGKVTPSDLISVYRLLRHLKPDLVHAHMVHANLIARLLKPLCQYKLICTAHSVYEVSGLLQRIYAATKVFANINTHVSNAGLVTYQQQGLFSQQAITVYNGINIPPEDTCKASSPDIFTLGFLCKLRAEKNVELLCEMALALHRRGRVFQILIAGEGEKRHYIEAFIAHHHLHKNIVLLGMVSDLSSFFSRLDVLVQTSHHEGLPTVLIEAGAYKTPVIATDVGGSNEIVRDGVSGLLVDAGSAVQLVNKVEELIDSPASRLTEMGAAGRAIVMDKFSIDNTVKQWQTLYKTTLGSSRDDY